MPADTVLTPGGAAAVPEATARHFDPGSLRVGDRFMGLVVTDMEVVRVFDDSVWSGRVQFAGEMTVSGVVQRHFDWPNPEALCLHVAGESVAGVPDFAPDSWTSPDAKVWFCFTDTERARALLGPVETPLRATVVVDDYTVRREFTDTYDTARLVRVEAVAGPEPQTLRELLNPPAGHGPATRAGRPLRGAVPAGSSGGSASRPRSSSRRRSPRRARARRGLRCHGAARAWPSPRGTSS